MRKENKIDEATLERIKQARDLLNEILTHGEKSRVPADRPKSSFVKAKKNSSSVDFSIPIRAFINKYSVGMNGPRKFCLLTAYLVKGDSNKKVSLLEIEKHWSKMTAKGMLGVDFNRFYAAQAKEKDWVDAIKGSYYLRPSWKEIF